MKKMLIDPIPDERLELLFRHSGLSEKQAKLYRFLLINGEERVSALSRKSGLKRGNVYALLGDLKSRGLIVEFQKGKITYFRPEPPSRLVDIIDTREKDIRIAHELATNLVPRLTSQYQAAINRPVVKLYEGKEGMQTVFEDIYGPKTGDKIVWGCVDIERVHVEFPEKLQKTLIPMRKKYGWVAKSIFSDNPAGRALKEKDTREARESYLIDSTTHPLPAEIDIYDDKITLLSFEQQEFVGLVIENKGFAQTLRSIFKLAYEHLQKQQALPDQTVHEQGQESAPDPRPAQKR